MRRAAEVLRRLRPRAADPIDPLAAEIEEEIAGHLELRAHELARDGLDAGSARAEALRRFGDPEPVLRECRELARRTRSEQRQAELLHGIAADLGLAVRLLARGRCFARPALAAVTIAVAASVIVVQAARSSLAPTPPYANADRAVMLWNRYAPEHADLFAVSPPEAAEMRAELRAFEQVASVRPEQTTVAAPGSGSERALAYHVSSGLFELLGVDPLLGTSLGQAERGAPDPGPDPGVVLSHALWERRFASDARIVGQRVRVGGEWHRVVGVMPPGARFPDGIGALPGAADLWVAHAPASLSARSRGDQVLAVVARLRPGRTLGDARAELDAWSVGAGSRTRLATRRRSWRRGGSPPYPCASSCGPTHVRPCSSWAARRRSCSSWRASRSRT